jgi:integrase
VISIDDGLIELLGAKRTNCEKAELLPPDALIFPSPDGKGDLTKPRDARSVSRQFVERAAKLGFPGLRFHDLRATHETLLLDAGVPVHVVAARCGHDPAVLLRVYARRTRKANTSAAAIIGVMSASVLGEFGSHLGHNGREANQELHLSY